jgi:serine/threonine-protein kinase HipA
MARPSKTRALGVWINGERAGTWMLRANGAEEFSYADGWLGSGAARPISLSMPLAPSGSTYRGDVVTAFFDNLLPDNREIRERIQTRFGTASMRPFDLLAEIGRDCLGAIQLLPEGEPPPDVRRIEGSRLTSMQIEKLLTDMLNPSLGRTGGDADIRIALGGAQKKIGLLRHDGHWMTPLGAAPNTHILKLPVGIAMQGIDLNLLVENEWLCAEILRAFGVELATSQIDRFGEQKVLVVERFDRRMSIDRSWIIRLPQEDLCQATGTPGSRRYESDGGPGIRPIMDLLLGSVQADQDRRDFLRTQILFWMLCAIDGHAKHFSLFLEAAGRYRLTLRYNVVSAFPMLGSGRDKLAVKEAKMAMEVECAGRHDLWHSIQRRHWDETARRCGMGKAMPALIDELIDRTPDVITMVGGGLPRDFPDVVAGSILEGLRRAAAKLAGDKGKVEIDCL